MIVLYLIPFNFFPFYLISFIINLWDPFPVTGFISQGLSLVAWMVKYLPAMQVTQFNPCVENIPWRREWLPIPLFLPEEFHGQGNLAACSP